MLFTSSHARGLEIETAYLIMKKKITFEKSLVPSRITYFLACRLTMMRLFILEKLICENVLISEKGKCGFIKALLYRKLFVLFPPESNNHAYNTDVVILALFCNLCDYN